MTKLATGITPSGIPNDVLRIEEHAEVALDFEQRALLALDVSWLEYRAEFRRQMIKQGFLKHPWRSIFEADMIFTLIGHKWLQGEILTVKQVATYFEAFTSDVTITRHIDDMVVSGTLVRTPDPKDRRRLLLMPTQRLFEIGRIFLEARKAIARRHGYVYDPARAASGQ
ncbi:MULTISPECIES: MarR family transcriptional regulator [Kaistia]|uniref:MarR family transcriptional regulator n=1 Tax=Kaistia nematophila TaxID=2994654 RepID=A0A9X3E043_9HYPH|nr:MarR family transcriptional regulator [Kaistia nematophila]MBN9058657.1 MarR family transcriptional regulator [Hyphomicrobiales bacterium]MCX5569055.1 MarR family transcriptional regulator [Kaistia nematophila]